MFAKKGYKTSCCLCSYLSDYGKGARSGASRSRA